ncbi:uncharacterized protein KQ657_001170 [Scheffersomyces spartinae]|uniref:Uncharacterized protein n=1 Tax=Scheffersomyces spartinae TaxID=45513 RepID=A0A9P7V8D6_9ASCO|nr:uncharacterized protein KQ657_001170 [Scheffersomyces spartinae]KAG7193053.1 hypothetical protein KQ657_001170 [Scheffersomyces spartinae]
MFDLNVPWPVSNYNVKPTPQQLTQLINTIATLYTLGYRYVAINFTLDEKIKLPNGPINPIDIQLLRARLSKYEGLKLFTRLTLIIHDPSQCQGLAKLQSCFDILAVNPITEKALQLATSNLDIDLVSLNFGSRLPYFLKHKTVGSAIEKGILFEICYSYVISGPAGYTLSQSNDSLNLASSALLIRKNFFNNVLQLIRASRSRGLVISSGATQPLQARNSVDVITLMKTLGMDHGRAKHFMTKNPENALRNGRLRIKSNKQTVIIDNRGDVLIDNQFEDPLKKGDTNAYKKKLDDTSSGRLLKKHKPN